MIRSLPSSVKACLAKSYTSLLIPKLLVDPLLLFSEITLCMHSMESTLHPTNIYCFIYNIKHHALLWVAMMNYCLRELEKPEPQSKAGEKVRVTIINFCFINFGTLEFSYHFTVRFNIDSQPLCYKVLLYNC